MVLKIRDVLELLEIPERKLFELIQAKSIPFHKINEQYRFNRAEINEWILSKNLPVTEKTLELSASSQGLSLEKKLRRGGIFFDVPGDTMEEVFQNAAALMPLPKGISARVIVSILLEREEIRPTAIGNGIAIPHPRSPLIADEEEESVSLCFLRNPLDFGASDGKAVHALFFVMSANSKRHLEILSRLAYVCRNPGFIKMIETQAKAPDIIAFVAGLERGVPEGSGK